MKKGIGFFLLMVTSSISTACFADDTLLEKTASPSIEWRAKEMKASWDQLVVNLKASWGKGEESPLVARVERPLVTSGF